MGKRKKRKKNIDINNPNKTSKNKLENITQDLNNQKRVIMETEKITINNLENKIESLNKYFKKYPNKTSTDNIKRITEDLNNQEYKIAVVANMSSGKSTFINALFGEEVLPAFNHATTDSATFVYSEPNIEKKAIIYFSDDKKQIEIKDDLEKEIKQYAQKDEECIDNKYKNVEKIELFYPFKNLQTSSSKDFKITFIDTPGPNSTGDGYKEKHKDQTRKVLNDVDLALFMFDYAQLDANLESDEQGLWNTIKKRHDKDKNFDVYFILNKIDYAFDDNFKDIDTKDKNEFIELKKRNWFHHEKIAIEKLENAAKKHGVDNPKIFPISSKFQLLTRDDNQNWDAQDELEAFQKSHFKRLFENDWEKECIEYMGVSKLENDINNYINSNVKDKILKKISSQLCSIQDDENKDLELRLQTLQKPQKEAEENLKKANAFLRGRAKEMQDEMKSESSKLADKYIKSLEKIIDDAIENELTNNIDEMAKKAIAFAQAFALDNKVNLAVKKANKNFKNLNLSSEIVKIEIDKEIDKKDVMQKMQEFMQTIFEDYKRNYLDLKSDIKEEYFNFKIESDKSISKYKNDLDKELESSLDVKIKDIETQSIDYDSMLTLNLQVPSSILDYNFEEAKYKTEYAWYDIFEWGGKEVKVGNEKHIFTISPSELKGSIKDSMEDSIAKFSNEEKRIHKITIKSHLATNNDIFQDFRHEKIKEINKLQKEIKFMEENLEKIQTQYSEFNKLKKDK